MSDVEDIQKDGKLEEATTEIHGGDEKITDEKDSLDTMASVEENMRRLESSLEADESKLDELTSLEREIAELHHVEPTAPSFAHKVHDSDSLKHDSLLRGDNMLLEMQSPSRNSTPADGTPLDDMESYKQKHANATEPLEEEDLIAVLQGIESDQKQKDVEDAEDAIGVTIEGEGEFQIMEIIDDEPEEVTDIIIPTTTTATKAPLPKLTREEERIMAMEQMAGLKNRNEIKRRRKQEMKAMAAETTDLITMLGADWSDEELGVEAQQMSPQHQPVAQDKAPTVVTTTKPITNTGAVEGAEKQSEKSVEALKRRNSPPKITSIVVLKGGTVHGVTDTIEKPLAKDKKEPEPVVTAPISTGFKRTRIIKRKIIWDPDAPETQFSYAQLVRSNANTATTSAKAKTEVAKVTTGGASLVKKPLVQKSIVQKPLVPKPPVQKKVRPVTPKDRKLTQLSSGAIAIEDKPTRAATPKLPTKAAAAIPAPASVAKQAATDASTAKTVVEPATSGHTSPVKRRAQTPVTLNGGIKKKKVTEIDRLMGDEGAVNMLNSLESERQKKAAETAENLPKPNMRSRSTTISERQFIKRDLTPVAKESTSPTTKTKRATKPKASASWDYVYKQQAANEDSMIIRRRSNSSYSSTASLHRLSIDSTAAASTTLKQKTTSKTATKLAATTSTHVSNVTVKSTNKSAPKTPSSRSTTPDTASADVSSKSDSLNASATVSPTGKNFEFAKPESKSNQKPRKPKSPQITNPLASDMKATGAVANRRAARSPSMMEEKEKPSSCANKSSPVTAAAPAKDEALTGITVRRLGKVAQLIFSTNKSKIEHTFNVELLNNIVDVLKTLRNDNDCNVVVMTTNAANFCHGIDFTELSAGTLEKRKKAAAQLGKSVQNFLQTLATFPKPLIAGVNGSNIGLGVTMLPLFDIVVASDKGSYETPYAKIGQVPEGYCIWNQLNKIRGTFKTKLFWLCEKLHSTESALSGLVNKLSTSNKVNDDALLIGKKMAALSAETFRAMKQTNAEANVETFDESLAAEFETIVAQWTSEECFENFKKYVQQGHW